jgi:hypothetical protein
MGGPLAPFAQRQADERQAGQLLGGRIGERDPPRRVGDHHAIAEAGENPLKERELLQSRRGP